MTTYRLFDGLSGRPGNGPATVTSYSGPFLAGTMFSVLGKMAWLDGYFWWVCNSGQSTAAQKFTTWNRYANSGTSQNLITAATATSGTLTAGQYNFVPLTAPVQLAPGGLYVASTGWLTSTGGATGFPDLQNQYGTGQPFASGISNGPLTAWSDLGASNTWPGPSGNYGLDQGLFSVAGTDPAIAMPNGGSNSANFWVDPSISDTPPPGYSGSYRVWPNLTDAVGFSNDTANNFTLGMEFSLTQACTINNVWFYSPPGVTQLPTWIGVYQVSGTSLVCANPAPAWSGPAGSGWIWAPMGGGTVLPAGVLFKVAACNQAASPAIWNGATANYWSTGFGGNGLTAGPIIVPDNASATSPGQDSYNLGSAPTFPATNVGPFNYWLDIEVTPAVSASASLLAPVPPWPLIRSACY